MEVKEPIPGVCNEKEVYALFPSLKGQEEDTSPVSKAEILSRLNNEIIFLKEHPSTKTKE